MSFPIFPDVVSLINDGKKVEEVGFTALRSSGRGEKPQAQGYMFRATSAKPPNRALVYVLGWGGDGIKPWK
jgi:hypothetical protein